MPSRPLVFTGHVWLLSLLFGVAGTALGLLVLLAAYAVLRK